MSEFGLELPVQTTKLGTDGKGSKGYIVKQSWAKTILAVTAVSLLLVGCLFFDLRREQSTFKQLIGKQHHAEEHQRLSKLQVETKLTEMSAVLGENSMRAKDSLSELKIMAQHIEYVHKLSEAKINAAIDDEKLTVADIKKQVAAEFLAMKKHVSSILNVELEVAHEAATQTEKHAKHIQAEVVKQVEEQEKEDATMAAEEAPEAVEINQEITEQLDAVFNHVYDLAEKMGDTDIDALLDETNVKKWDQLLTDTETGKIVFPDAIKKMEEILTAAPAALKLADVTGTIQLVEEDGGAKGVNELTNFRSLLKEVKRLPEYSLVLTEFEAWKKGERTAQQVLLWTQKQISEGKVDPVWMAKAYDAGHKKSKTHATASSRYSATTSATSTSSTGPATGTSGDALPQVL